MVSKTSQRLSLANVKVFFKMSCKFLVARHDKAGERVLKYFKVVPRREKIGYCNTLVRTLDLK